MLTSLHIKNFRGFRDLKIDSLARVNLIAGKNNVGKTGILEAIYLLLSNTDQFFNFASAFRAGTKTQDDFQSFWMWLSSDKNWGNPIEIEMLDETGNKLQVSSAIQSNNGATKDIAFSCRNNGQAVVIKAINNTGSGSAGTPIADVNWPSLAVLSTKPSAPNDDADLFNQLNLIRGGRQKIVALLKALDPRLVDLQYIKVWQQPLVYAELTDLKELAPLTQLGQGFTRLVRLFAEMIIAEAKVVLIDEIENGIHHSALPQVWTGLAEIARQEDLQIFATTHSWECIQAAHQVFSASTPYDFALHRLQRVKGDIQAVTHDQGMIAVAAETELEIR